MAVITNQRSRVLGGGGLPVPVPTLGAEMLVDGGLENWTSATNATNWQEGINGASSVNRESSVVRGGTYAARIDVDAINSSCYIRSATTMAAGTWVQVRYWSQANQASKTVRVDLGSVLIGTHTLSNGAWTQCLSVVRAAGANPNFDFSRAASASTSIYIDDVSVCPIDLASMFSSRAYTTHATTKAACTIVAGTQAGVVANLDDPVTPTSFVIASHDGATARLTQFTGGTYTEKVSATVAYSAGATVEIRRLAGTDTYRLFYAGSQVGTDQTISGINGLYHGYFNSFSGNVVSGFSCVAA